jgi:transposase
MQTQTNYIGIDISKSFFDAAVPDRAGYSYYKFSNDETGFESLLKVLPQQATVVMEASGPYYLRQACFLTAKGIAVSVVNPLVIRRFGQMRMSRTKTDRKDAKMIAEYGKSEKPALWQAPQQYMITMQQMEAVLDNLKRDQAALSNQLKSFESSGLLGKELRSFLITEIRQRNAAMDHLTGQLEHLATSHYAELLTAIESIPGIGKKTAMALIVLSCGFQRFDNYRKLSSYIGLCPRIFESGTSVKGKARICKMGMSRIRALLYVCAWSARRCNKACRELYERLLKKGKAKKLALIAVANKLLKQAFAIAKNQSCYNENYVKNSCF